MTDIVVVQELGTTVLIQEVAAASAIQVVAQGPQGPQGIKGDSGDVNPLNIAYAESAATSATNAATSATSSANSAAASASSASAAGVKATEAVTSATSAANSATASNTSATNAAVSATTATDQAAIATTQAGIATTQATTATTQATAAQNSATNAATSASNAASSESSASTSATTATTKAAESSSSAASAATSATTATTKEGQASVSANNAATSATTATEQATTATNQANQATTSATSAATSATTATNQASAASSSATSAAASATTATTQAGIATTKASEAAASAAQAASSANTAVSGGIRYDTAQTLSAENKAQARSNMGLATVASSGSYADLSNKPTLPVIGSTVQAWGADLDAIDALTGTTGLLKKTAANTWALDTSAYLTGITSSQVTTALGFTPYNNTNPSGYISSVPNTAVNPGTYTNANITVGQDGRLTSASSGGSIPQNSKSSAYTLVASDSAKHIATTAGGVTIPSGVFSAGAAITIYNNSASSQTITQGSGLTLQWAGQTSSTTGNRTLGLYGICTVLYISASVAVISGAGLT